MNQLNLSLHTESSDPRRVFRARRGDVKLALLDLLSDKGATTGYGLMQHIRDKSGGVWKVSAGSVYPTLEKLQHDGLIEERYRDGTTYYVINSVGRSFLVSKTNEVKRIWSFSEEKDLGALQPLEAELTRLSEAIQLASRSGTAIQDKVMLDIIDLRKQIFGYLSE